MTSRAITRTAGVCGLLLLLAACGGSSGGTSTGAPPTGTPTNGGTLKLLGSGDVDHLDPASAYYTVSYTLERAFTRQLVSYPASSDLTTATTVAPDLATSLPTTSNGGITNGDKTYTFHLRTDAQWNTSPARAVTAADVVRGLQRICNPASPSGGLTYYEDTIAGFTQFCDGFAKVNAADPAAMASYMNGHQISGVTTPDTSTVVINLTQPASDFLNILALPFASAAPVEYLKYVPDGATFRQHTLSDGPYAITSYQPGRSIVLDRNPAWTQASDPLRHQHVATIDITQGQGSDQAVQQQLQAGHRRPELGPAGADGGPPGPQGVEQPEPQDLPERQQQPVPGVQPAQPQQQGRAGEREGAAGARVRDRQDGHRQDLRRPDA